MTRVVIFDDNAQRRDGLRMLINAMNTMACIGCYPDGREAAAHIAEMDPDVVLMDIDMPHVDGISAVRNIRAAYPDLKILMQTVFEDDEKVFAAICAGADGYILKQADPLKLIDAISEVLGGGAPMTPTVARKVLQLFNRKNQTPAKESFQLTKRELEILGLLVKGYSYKMIATEYNISYPTVNSHVSNIYAKLKVQSVGGAVSIALREGLVK